MDNKKKEDEKFNMNSFSIYPNFYIYDSNCPLPPTIPAVVWVPLSFGREVKRREGESPGVYDNKMIVLHGIYTERRGRTGKEKLRANKAPIQTHFHMKSNKKCWIKFLYIF